MENKPAAAQQAFDPKADLELLNRAKSSVDLDHVLDFGPWWYAPLIASCLGGANLIGQDFTTRSSLILGGIAVAAGVVVTAHDFGRRTVRPKFSLRSAGLLSVIILTVVAIFSLWSAAVSTIGADRFLPWYAILGWLLTTALFLTIRSVSYWLRGRRAVLI